MSVLFNHACRYELFDSNPIHLVRQGAKRNKTPSVLTPAEIRVLADGLAIRERTLVLLAASTGLRQSELFGLQWGDINFAEGTMNVTRSIVCGVVGSCKTESSQKPVPIHPLVVDALTKWREVQRYRKLDDWVFASDCRRGRKPYWGQAILRKYILPKAQNSESKDDSDGIPSGNLLYSFEERRHGIEGNARAASALLTAIYLRRLYPGHYSGQACCSSRRRCRWCFLHKRNRMPRRR